MSVFKCLKIGALGAAVALTMGLGNCRGVAEDFHQDNSLFNDVSSESQVEDALREERLALNKAYSNLVNKYNDGTEEFETAQDEDVKISEKQAEAYEDLGAELKELGERIEDYREQLTDQDKLEAMTEKQLTEADQAVAEMAGQLEGLLGDLRKMVNEWRIGNSVVIN